MEATRMVQRDICNLQIAIPKRHLQFKIGIYKQLDIHQSIQWQLQSVWWWISYYTKIAS